jgi:hypothetical protein
MSQQAYLTVIDDLKRQITAKEHELIPLKTMVNHLCKQAGVDEEYSLDPGAGIGAPGSGRTLKFRTDEFFNKGLAPSVVAIMEARDKLGMERPVSVDDIFSSLVSGGFRFEGSTGTEENSKRALKIALTKNTLYFVKIGDNFSLKKWYGMRAPRKPRQDGGETEEETATPDAGPESTLFTEPVPSNETEPT